MDYLLHGLGENIAASLPAGDRINADESHLASSTKTPAIKSTRTRVKVKVARAPRTR
jgi:hypothetical protein